MEAYLIIINDILISFTPNENINIGLPICCLSGLAEDVYYILLLFSAGVSVNSDNTFSGVALHCR